MVTLSRTLRSPFKLWFVGETSWTTRFTSSKESGFSRRSKRRSRSEWRASSSTSQSWTSSTTESDFSTSKTTRFSDSKRPLLSGSVDKSPEISCPGSLRTRISGYRPRPRTITCSKRQNKKQFQLCRAQLYSVDYMYRIINFIECTLKQNHDESSLFSPSSPWFFKNLKCNIWNQWAARITCTVGWCLQWLTYWVAHWA